MGAPATRITREELLVPPEFSDRIPFGHEAARVGGARIELFRHGDETRLGACFQQVPIRLMPPFVFDGESASLLYLINLTAGLLDGDGHLIDLTVRPAARAVVTGQSATRVHPAVNSYSTQQWRVNVEADACLVVLPGPTIPYRGSRYFQRARVELGENSRLLWGDIWLAGRCHRGPLSERFEFERLVQDFEIHRGGQLVFRDHFCWDGPWTDDAIRWHTGGAFACASLFVGGPLGTLPQLHDSSVRRSVFPLLSGDTCIRWCGEPTAVTRDLVLVAMRMAAYWTDGPDAPPWLLNSSSLAPNHWFSLASGREPTRILAHV